MAEEKPKISLEESVVSPTGEKEWRLVSDPVDSLHREIMWTEKQRKNDYDHLKELFKEATQGRDRAITLLEDFRTSTPTTAETAGKVDALKELTLEMFRAVNSLILSTKTEAQIALAAALQTQEKAATFANTSLKDSIEKTEGQFIKQIDQMRETSAQSTTNTDGKINDIKDRLTAIENLSKGAQNLWAIIMAIIMAVIASGALAALVLKK